MDAGPSFTTQRQEAAAFYTSLVQGQPAMAAIIGDVMMASMDIPQSQMVAARIKAEMVKSGKAYLLTQEEIQDLIKKLPMVAMPTPPPPALIAKVQKDLAQAELAKAKAQAELAKTGQVKMESMQMLMEALERYSMSVMQMGQPQPGQQPGVPGMPQGVPGPTQGMMPR